MKRDLPWRRRQRAQLSDSLFARVLRSRPAWVALGGVIVFVLIHGVEAMGNLRKLPSEFDQTIRQFWDWYYDAADWSATWSSREEGHVEDYRQSAMPIKLSLVVERGKVSGEIFNLEVCKLNPLFVPVLLEGEIFRGDVVAYTFAIVGGQKYFLFSFSAQRSDREPVITIAAIRDPLGLLPEPARLVRRADPVVADEKGAVPTALDHPDFECAETPSEYVKRILGEAGIDQRINQTAPKERRPIEELSRPLPPGR